MGQASSARAGTASQSSQHLCPTNGRSVSEQSRARKRGGLEHDEPILLARLNGRARVRLRLRQCGVADRQLIRRARPRQHGIHIAGACAHRSLERHQPERGGDHHRRRGKETGTSSPVPPGQVRKQGDGGLLGRKISERKRDCLDARAFVPAVRTTEQVTLQLATLQGAQLLIERERERSQRIRARTFSGHRAHVDLGRSLRPIVRE